MKEIINKWVKLGKANPWIGKAYDPPFGRNSLVECKSAEELAKKLVQTWTLGQGFYWNNQCWINQINCGSEWLVIKDSEAFESVSARLVAGASYHNNHQITNLPNLIDLIELYDRTPAKLLAKLEYNFNW